MKQKPFAPNLNGLKVCANAVPVSQHYKSAVGRYGLKQPGYYLIRLRLRHSQKAIRSLAKIP